VGFIFSLNNITASGKIAASGQELHFLIDMKVLGVPVKASFTLTPKSGREIDTKSIAEAAFNQTAEVIESSTEEELTLLQLDISGYQMYDDSVLDAVVKAAEHFGVAADLAGVGVKPFDVTFLKLLRGEAPEPKPVSTSQPMAKIFDEAKSRAGEVQTEKQVAAEKTPTRQDVGLSKARIALIFVPKPNGSATPANTRLGATEASDTKPTEADLDKITKVLANELGGNFTKYHFLCQYAEFQKSVVPSSLVEAPQGSDTWSNQQKKAYVDSLKDPSELVTKFAVRCAVLTKVTEAQLIALAGKLRWYSELQGPSLLGKGHLLRSTLPLEQAQIVYEPVPSSNKLVLQVNGQTKPDRVKALIAAQTGIDESRLKVTVSPGVSSLIRLQSGAETSADANTITIDVSKDVLLEVGQVPSFARFAPLFMLAVRSRITGTRVGILCPVVMPRCRSVKRPEPLPSSSTTPPQQWT
jgi:hypothetical protein